jgi:hypothetical protein
LELLGGQTCVELVVHELAMVGQASDLETELVRQKKT